jgi:hypothetical protein
LGSMISFVGTLFFFYVVYISIARGKSNTKSVQFLSVKISSIFPNLRFLPARVMPWSVLKFPSKTFSIKKK